MDYDVIIAGGGPAGLAAALALGRARKRVLLCDAGPPRNAAAVHVQNFVTRDGTPPAEFRRIARGQLEPYSNVVVRDTRIGSVEGTRGAFHVRMAAGNATSRRVLLSTGMVDDFPDIDGFRALWGQAIFACPYCHGWEVQDRRFGYLATNTEALAFPLLLRGWTRDLIAFTNGAVNVPDDIRARFASADIHIDERPIVRLVGSAGQLERVEFADGGFVERDVLFAHPRQRQAEVVIALGLALDDKGFVRVSDTHETSVPGIYAAGDLITHAQAAIAAAASGMLAAAALNRELTAELATSGALA